MVTLAVVSFIVAFLVSIACIRYGRTHAAKYGFKPQRFHAGAIPRIGGACIWAGLFSGWLAGALLQAWGTPLNINTSLTWILSWAVVLIPATSGGLYEDVSQQLAISRRLLLTALSSLLACVLLQTSVNRIGIEFIDQAIAVMPWIGFCIAFLAICGLPHAFNLIDGYNGLAGIVAILVTIALIHVALQLGDRQLAATLICLVGATAGFLVWNYPRGLIFAGDGGAYLWGLVVAIGCILLVQRHPLVSPWFPMLLLIYPVWETLFSVYRKLARGVSPGVADALHFHQLIYRRIVRTVFHDDESRRMLMRNNRTSPYLWSFTLLTIVPAVMFWNNTLVLAAFCMLFVVSYVVAYIAIIRFKVPNWLRR